MFDFFVGAVDMMTTPKINTLKLLLRGFVGSFLMISMISGHAEADTETKMDIRPLAFA